ncbi:hypothetical protein BSK61_29990 [Paenibacillus odorifer]|nr:hypothetical protein BSK61_29990 [Paenibacillus odorifer]
MAAGHLPFFSPFLSSFVTSCAPEAVIGWGALRDMLTWPGTTRRELVRLASSLAPLELIVYTEAGGLKLVHHVSCLPSQHSAIGLNCR